MTKRRTALAFAIILVSLAGAQGARAERLHTGGIPLSGNNTVIATNLAAGMNNTAQQQSLVAQSGGPAQGLVSNNTVVNTNVAAGINNRAQQNGMVLQGSAPTVGLDFSGRGPMVTTRVGVNTNVAAGLNNQAVQGNGLVQR